MADDTVSLGMDAESAELVLRCLSTELDRLVGSGRDPRTDREVVVLGVYCETLDRWLMEREQGTSTSKQVPITGVLLTVRGATLDWAKARKAM